MCMLHLSPFILEENFKDFTPSLNSIEPWFILRIACPFALGSALEVGYKLHFSLPSEGDNLGWYIVSLLHCAEPTAKIHGGC